MSAVLWLLLACPTVLIFWLVQAALDGRAYRRTQPHTSRRAQTGHGRHRRGGTPR